MRHPPAGLRAAHADRPRPSRGRRVGVVAAIAGILALVAAPAQAHDALLSSEPADGAVLTAPPTQVVLTFASPQAEIGAEVVVTGPDGAAWSDGAAAVAGVTVTQALQRGLPSGEYAVLWRSVAADGHPVDGALAFTLDLPVTPTTPSAAPASVASPPVATPAQTLADAPEDPTDAVASRVPWLAAGALFAIVTGFALVWLSRRRSV